MCAPKVLVLRCLMSCWLPNGVFSDVETYPWWNLSIYSIPAKKRTMNSFLPVLPNSRRKDVQKLLPGWRGDVVIDQRRICGGEAKLIWHRNLIEHMSYCIYIYAYIHVYYISIYTCWHFCQSCMILDPQQTSNHGFGLQLSWESAWNGESSGRAEHDSSFFGTHAVPVLILWDAMDTFGLLA